VRKLSLARATAAVALLTVPAACTVGPDFLKPKPDYTPASLTDGHTTDPGKQKLSTPVVAKPDPTWWKVFGDPQLTALETRVAGANLDVKVAALRLAESRATLGITESALLPQMRGDGGYIGQKPSKAGALSLFPTPGGSGAGNQAQNNGALFDPFSLWQYGLDASWEIDFWGRVRRDVESSLATMTATGDQERGVLITAQAELARDYVQLRGAQAALETTQHNLDIAKQSLALTQQRAAGGLTTELDVANAAAQVETTASDIPPLQARIDTLSNAIALLLGAPPQSMTRELAAAHPVPPVPPQVPVGLPSELARRRPDIRVAEANLHAATANVGVAVGDFYPRVTLSGSVAMQAVQFSNLGTWADASTWSIGPSITIPIFEGGRLQRNLELKEKQQQQAAVEYQRTVLNALHDVDNALTEYDAAQRRRNTLLQAVAQNRKAVQLAQDRYAQGVADFLDVLVTERSLFQTELLLTDSTTTVSSDMVQIYKALGGGWETALPEQTPPDTSIGAVAKQAL
jgi:NodT family efflux transporter outer membrane factor (OMF) lipoprotein